MVHSRQAAMEVSPESAKTGLDAGELVLVDCRTPAEHATAAIDAAVLVPMHELPARIEELAAYRHQRVVVFCHHGMRSLQAAHDLRQAGFAKATSMAGGIDAWARRVDPSVPRY